MWRGNVCPGWGCCAASQPSMELLITSHLHCILFNFHFIGAISHTFVPWETSRLSPLLPYSGDIPCTTLLEVEGGILVVKARRLIYP